MSPQKMVTPAARREAVAHLQAGYQVSERRRVQCSELTGLLGALSEQPAGWYASDERRLV